jgi:PAS domain-containing protein
MKSVTEEQVSALLAAIYQAALDPASWPAMLPLVDSVVACVKGGIALIDAHSLRMVRFHNWGFAQADLDAYHAHYINLDPRPRYFLRDMSHAVYYDQRHHGEGEMDRSEYYDWMRQAAGVRYYFASARLDEDGVISALAMNRTKAQGHVDQQDIERLERLAPHVHRALALGRRVGDLELRAAALDLAYGASQALIMLDEDARVVFMNQAAEPLCGPGGALSIDRDGRLRGARRDEDRRLQTLVGRAVATGCGKGTAPGGDVALARPDGRWRSASTRRAARRWSPQPGRSRR